MKELSKAYNNFLKYEKEVAGKTESTPSRGLLSPKTIGAKKNQKSNKQMDTILRYVQEIRKHRKGNGKEQK